MVAATFAAGIIVTALLRGFGDKSSIAMPNFWLRVVSTAAMVFAGLFLVFFILNLIRAARTQPEDDILDQETPESELLHQPLYGFVTMEFYWGILNRTFLVVAAPDSVYGWKLTGPVTNADRRFFEPYQEMLKDSDFMRDLPAIRKLAGLPGGFIYPKSEIVAVTSDDRRQWGMGGIAHSGHVYLRLLSGATRKFIILGKVISDEARDRIVATIGAGLTSRA